VDEQPAKQRTLRELVKETEFVGRELADHLERNFVPRVERLSRLIRPQPGGKIDEEVESRSVHTHVDNVLESYQFTHKVLEQFHFLIQSLDESLTRVIDES